MCVRGEASGAKRIVIGRRGHVCSRRGQFGASSASREMCRPAAYRIGPRFVVEYSGDAPLGGFVVRGVPWSEKSAGGRGASRPRRVCELTFRLR